MVFPVHMYVCAYAVDRNGMQKSKYCMYTYRSLKMISFNQGERFSELKFTHEGPDTSTSASGTDSTFPVIRFVALPVVIFSTSSKRISASPILLMCSWQTVLESQANTARTATSKPKKCLNALQCSRIF